MQGKAKASAAAAADADGSALPKGNASGVKRLGKRSLRFYQKESNEILDGE